MLENNLDICMKLICFLELPTIKATNKKFLRGNVDGSERLL